mmetsp:Transcript_6251/g.10774  ORF Transcript_6251/g.10774 Transcript_6251/m.10774 type:complete len:411 (+) Transcript_6251:36-1268(+)
MQESPDAGSHGQSQPTNSFMAFAQKRRRELTLEQPGIPQCVISRQLGEEWRSLPAEDRNHFVVLSRKLRDAYNGNKRSRLASSPATSTSNRDSLVDSQSQISKPPIFRENSNLAEVSPQMLMETQYSASGVADQIETEEVSVAFARQPQFSDAFRYHGTASWYSVSNPENCFAVPLPQTPPHFAPLLTCNTPLPCFPASDIPPPDPNYVMQFCRPSHKFESMRPPQFSLVPQVPKLVSSVNINSHHAVQDFWPSLPAAEDPLRVSMAAASEFHMPNSSQTTWRRSQNLQLSWQSAPDFQPTAAYVDAQTARNGPSFPRWQGRQHLPSVQIGGPETNNYHSAGPYQTASPSWDCLGNRRLAVERDCFQAADGLLYLKPIFRADGTPSRSSRSLTPPMGSRLFLRPQGALDL